MAHHGVPSITHAPHLAHRHPRNRARQQFASNRNTPPFKFPPTP